MALQYYLKPFELRKDTKDSGSCRAVCTGRKGVGLEAVFKEMTRQGSTITRAEALAAFEEMNRAILSLLMQGYNVNTPLIHISCSIGGVFSSDEDNFDRKRHQVRIRLKPGKRLTGITASVKPRKVAPVKRGPRPGSITDLSTGQKNSVLTPGRTARLTGEHLKINADHPGEGLFFINLDQPDEPELTTELIRNTPKELLFEVPELISGCRYRLEVRNTPRFAGEMVTGSPEYDCTATG